MTTPLRVLIIEDSEDDTQLLLQELQRGDYAPTYERVETAEAMATALHEQAWDILISDWSLPRFSALRALEILKRSAIDLPFLIVSGTVAEGTAADAMRAGAPDFLFKGKLSMLVPTIERELRRAQVRRAPQQIREQLMLSEAQTLDAVRALMAGLLYELDDLLNKVHTLVGFSRHALAAEHAIAADLGASLAATEKAQRLTHHLLTLACPKPVDDNPRAIRHQAPANWRVR